MRALVLIVVLVAGVAEARSPAPRRVPPFERNCTRAESSEKLSECIDTHAKGATVVLLAPDLQRVRTPEGREYLFVRFGENWHVVYRPGDANYEMVGRSELKVGTEMARRIDIGHHVPIGNRGVFFERITLLCPADRCSVYTTACTVVQRGRAVETFRGEVQVTNAGIVTIVGDRSHATSLCRGR